MAKDLLFEICVQELPPRLLLNLSESFHSNLINNLTKNKLGFKKSEVFATPRRIAVLFHEIDAKQEDFTQTIEGPSKSVAFDEQGKPTKALIGFMHKNKADLSELDTSGAKVKFVCLQLGELTENILPKIINKSLQDLQIPKKMRWGANRFEFIRPVMGQIFLFGEKIIENEIFGVQSSNITTGHRVHGYENITINTPKEYEQKLNEAFVIASFSKRKQLILEQINSIARSCNALAIIPDDLLNEVTALTEFPNAILCSFDEKYLNAPQEALIATMQNNQKYFCLTDQDNKLLNSFIVIINLQSKNVEVVIKGNEKVVIPRLADAIFFFEQDKKKTFAQFNEKLQQVSFQAKIGSMYQRVLRIMKIAEFLSTKFGFNKDYAKRAAELSKADLVSLMVNEFPELQGIAGFYYANFYNEPQEVAIALKEQYMPVASGAALASTQTGQVLSMSDKFELIVSIFAADLIPTGSKDPFALRRAALTIVRLAVEKQLSFDLYEVIEFVRQLHQEELQKNINNDQIALFILERLKAYYEEIYDTNIVNAAFAAKEYNIMKLHSKIVALNAIKDLADLQVLSNLDKRIKNILSKEQPVLSLNSDLFEKPAEEALHLAVQTLKTKIDTLNDDNKLQALISLNPLIERFFEECLINHQDAQVKNNRIFIIYSIREIFSQIADFSHLYQLEF